MLQQTAHRRRPLDLNKPQAAWFTRLWLLLSNNVRSLCGGLLRGDRALFACAYQTLNLRLLAVATLVGDLVATMQVRSVLEAVSSLPGELPPELTTLKAACRFLLCDPATDAVFPWHRDPLASPPAIYRLLYGSGIPATMAEMNNASRYNIMYTSVALTDAIADVLINKSWCSPPFVAEDAEGRKEVRCIGASSCLLDVTVREQLHHFLNGLVRLRSLCKPGLPLTKFASAVEDACAVANRLGLWVVDVAYAVEVEAFTRWRDGPPTEGKVQLSHLSGMDKVVQDNHSTGLFKLISPHRKYWEHVAHTAAARARKEGSDSEAARQRILGKRMAWAALNDELYAFGAFPHELRPGQPIDAERLACMLATMLAVFKDEAWDVAEHIFGSEALLHPMDQKRLAPARDKVQAALDSEQPLSAACAGSACTSEADASGQLGRPAMQTSQYCQGCPAFEKELYFDLCTTSIDLSELDLLLSADLGDDPAIDTDLFNQHPPENEPGFAMESRRIWWDAMSCEGAGRTAAAGSRG